MKKTDWTDRMLAALVELYPVETTAYTAAVLNLSESTVKLKARELGLVKMAKYNPQIQISAESETKRSIFRKRDKTKRSKKESAQHSKSRNKSFVMTSVSAL